MLHEIVHHLIYTASKAVLSKSNKDEKHVWQMLTPDKYSDNESGDYVE